MDRAIKIIVEKHTDGYAAYEGDTYEAALLDVKSAIQFHIETFGLNVFPD
jgi:hypothetical protein